MSDLAPWSILVALLLIFGAYIVWAVRDATRRHKSRLLVLIAVVLFFPFGLIAWLLFRPPVSGLGPGGATN